MRRRRADKRKLTPDVRYQSELVSYLINMVMRQGKRSIAESIVYNAVDQAEGRLHQDALDIFLQALENCKPQVQVKSRRVGGTNYQVPVEVDPERQAGIALRWLVGFARRRKGKTMEDALGAELMDAFNNTGSTVKKKDETHSMAAANKAFAHYRW